MIVPAARTEGTVSGSSEVDADVVVVGAGPVGLTLASLLGLRGITTIVLEREEDVFPLPRAAHIDHTGLRLLQEIGILDELLSSMIPNSRLVLADNQLRPLASVPGGQGSVSGLPASMFFYQPDFDRRLERAATECPSVKLERGADVFSVEQEDERAAVLYRHLKTGTDQRVYARFVVACDGARSTVREIMDTELESLDFDERWLVLDLEYSQSSLKVPDYAIQVCDPVRPWVANPIPGGRYRLELRLHDEDGQEVIDELSDFEFVRSHLEPLIGARTDFVVTRRATYAFHGLVASRWRDRRVLLAGDAAHQMPPFLGQGMCSGMRDVANLAWKIALVLEGKQRPEFLDTYQSERFPHVLSIVASAVEFGRFVSVSNAETVAERNAMLRAGELAAVPSFTLPRLTGGGLVGRGGGVLFPQHEAPDGLRSDDMLGPRLCLIALTPELFDSDALTWWQENFGARPIAVAELGDLGSNVESWLAAQDARVVAVRPDRYVMAIGISLDDLRESLAQFGEPVTHRLTPVEIHRQTGDTSR